MRKMLISNSNYKIIANNILKKLKSVTYGVWDTFKKQPVTPDSEIWKDSEYVKKYLRVLPPQDVIKYKCGTCIDTSIFIYTELLKHYKDVRMYYMENMKNNSILHITTIFQAEDKNWYNLEWSWLKNYGLHGPYKTKEEFIKSVENKFEKQYGEITLSKFIENPKSAISKLPMQSDLFIEELL